MVRCIGSSRYIIMNGTQQRSTSSCYGKHNYPQHLWCTVRQSLFCPYIQAWKERWDHFVLCWAFPMLWKHCTTRMNSRAEDCSQPIVYVRRKIPSRVAGVGAGCLLTPWARFDRADHLSITWCHSDVLWPVFAHAFWYQTIRAKAWCLASPDPLPAPCLMSCMISNASKHCLITKATQSKCGSLVGLTAAILKGGHTPDYCKFDWRKWWMWEGFVFVWLKKIWHSLEKTSKQFN